MTSTKHGAGIAALAIALAIACGADERAREERTLSRATPPPEEQEPAPPPPPREVPGAAESAGGELPSDVVPLASRYAPRALSIPRVPAGRAAGFTFDGGKRGWFARLPESTPQQLLTPTYAAGRVYLGGGFASHQLYALEASSGRVEWMAAAPDGGPTAAIAVGDKILFNTESCTLFAVDAATGRQRWSRWLGDPLMSQPAAANGRVFSGHIRDGGGYGFTAMDLDTGRVLWTRAISADVMNAPVLDGESVFFTTMDGVVWRLDQANGRRAWRRALHATSAPWLHEDAVHVARRRAAGREEQSVVLSIADGALVREHEPVTGRFTVARPDGAGVPAGWAYEGSRPTIVDGRLYQTIGDEVQSRDAATGELLWRRRNTERASRRPASPPAVAGGQLVFGTQDGVLYGLDIDTGLTAWAYDVGTPITSQPTVAHGWVFASTARGGVVGLEVGDASVGGWHMWGGDARHNGPVEEVAADAPRVEDDRPTEGTLRLRGAAEDGELAGFPLVGTSVDARVSGFAARVEVEQTFENPYERAIEAVYLFPLPDDAAVDGMELHTGERVVRGQIRERTEARREYRAARDRGVLASLLEQERPNLFRQAVANILPGERVRVVLRYTQVLPYEAGSYRFVFPMVAGPRYTPRGEGEPADDAEGGVSQVVLAPGAERSDRVDVRISASLGGTLRDVTSPTHELDVARPSDRSARVTLSRLLPDRDLDVRFAVAGDEPSLAVLASPPRGERPGYASILVHPRLEVPEAEITPRELVVVIDTSSSMRGRAFELARAAGLRALEGLRETDTFRLVRFSDRASELAEGALPATRENVARARAYLEAMTALGATEMRRGLEAALEPPIERGRLRIVLLVTDGYIGNEGEVLREVGARLGGSRVFALGVGAAANRYLLSRVSEVGRGDTAVVTLDESPEEAADAFLARITSPYLTDIELDWGGLPIESVYPRRAPDLFADRPLVLHGRYARGGRGEVTIRGRIAGRPFEQRVEVELPSEAEPREEVASLWARTRIRDLMTAMTLQPSDALREEVTRLGLEHSLVTQWTSFVAIDEGPPRTGGRPSRVHQPSALPSGTDYGGEARRVGNAGAGYGGLSLSGQGMGGGGYGMGAIGVGGPAQGYRAAPSAARIPAIRAGTAEVRGSLSREVIRRQIHRQLNAVRYCYEQHLLTHPDMEGRVTVSFVIAEGGSVSAARVGSSTLGHAATEECIVAVIRRIHFPAVEGGGVVAVNYPFELRARREDE